MPPSIQSTAAPQLGKGTKPDLHGGVKVLSSSGNKTKFSTRKTKNFSVDKKSSKLRTGKASDTTTSAKANSENNDDINGTAISSQPANDYGMGLGFGGGMGLYGGMGFSPYGMGGGMMMGGGPLSGLNQFLFGFQNLIFSLGQAMQILGMNTQALQQLFHTGMSMFDNTIQTLNEMNAICAVKETASLTEEEIKKRRRLKALRWTIVLGVSFTGYKIIRKWLRQRRLFREYASRFGSPSTHSRENLHMTDNRYQRTFQNYAQPNSFGSSYSPYNGNIPSHNQYGNHINYMGNNYSSFGNESSPYGAQGIPFNNMY